MDNLSSVLGGLVQGFKDLGKSTADMIGGTATSNIVTSGLDALVNKKSLAQAIKDADQRKRDFRRWLYDTDSDKDAAAKGLGTALNGAQAALDLIPGVGQSAPVNALQGALGGLSDEFKFNGENYDLGKAGQRALASGATSVAVGNLGKDLAKIGKNSLSNAVMRGAATGGLGGALGNASNAAIDGADASQIWEAAKSGAGLGALIGGGTAYARNGGNIGFSTKIVDEPEQDVKRIGSKDVAPVDEATLPDSLRMANDYIKKGYIADIENATGKKYDKMTDSDFLDYALNLKAPNDRELFREIIQDMVDAGSTTYKKYADSAAANKYLEKILGTSFDDMDSKKLMLYLHNNKNALQNNTIKDVDAELSDRLGIGRSNTFMVDNKMPSADAIGVYNPVTTTMSIDTKLPKEKAVNTLAHERLHSFQTEGDFKRYDKRVTDAYEELSSDLAKHLKTPEETKERYQFDADYWGDEREQQSRMLQQYLENKGFTKSGLEPANAGEWGNEINPAFDKFFDKLRALSKKGVALPALTALFGGGALAASQQDNEEKEYK